MTLLNQDPQLFLRRWWAIFPSIPNVRKTRVLNHDFISKKPTRSRVDTNSFPSTAIVYMSPTGAIRSPKRTGFYPTQFLHLFRKSESFSPIPSKIDNILYSRQSSQENSQQDGPALGHPYASNIETTTKPAGQGINSYIPGVLFVAVVISSAVVLSLAIFIPVCWRRRRRNRQNTLPTEEHPELPGLGEKDPSKQICDAPRPDSTTLPIQGILMRVPVRGRQGTTESPGDILNFNAAISTKSAWSGSLSHQEGSRSSSTLAPKFPPAGLRFPPKASLNPNRVGDFRLPTIPSGPQPMAKFPTIASLASDAPPASAVMDGEQHARHSNSGLFIVAHSTRNKLRKKTRSDFEQTPAEPRPVAPFSRISTFGGFGRASAGSMSNYWATWWESSGDEEEGDPIMEINKRRL